MVIEQPSFPRTSDPFDKNVPYYIKDADVPAVSSAARKVLEEYSGVPPAEVQSHVLKVRECAWQIHPFPCIGSVRFLDFSLSTMPSYKTIIASLSKTNDPTTLLDVGCCFGQDLRKLIVDGAPASQVVGVDLRPEFIDLGYELFLDRATFDGRFVAGDVFDKTPGNSLEALEGTISFVHVTHFFHLFDREQQVAAASRLVRFLKDEPGTVILGRQLGAENPGAHEHRAGTNGMAYSHDQESFQKFWGEVGAVTKTPWKLDTSMETVMLNGMPLLILNFEATRLA
ncbi:hypothetical protein ACLMJK_001077 [Lecanora helva]